jgi:hypothetical protein
MGDQVSTDFEHDGFVLTLYAGPDGLPMVQLNDRDRRFVAVPVHVFRELDWQLHEHDLREVCRRRGIPWPGEGRTPDDR